MFFCYTDLCSWFMSPELVPRAYPEDGSPIFRLKISLDEKNIVFYFCFIFSRSSSPSPSWVKKIILRGSGAFRLVGNLVPRGKARRWLNLLHWWNGKRKQIKNIDRFLIGITLASQKRQLIRHVAGWSYRTDETSLPKIRFSSLFASGEKRMFSQAMMKQ